MSNTYLSLFKQASQPYIRSTARKGLKALEGVLHGEYIPPKTSLFPTGQSGFTGEGTSKYSIFKDPLFIPTTLTTGVVADYAGRKLSGSKPTNATKVTSNGSVQPPSSGVATPPPAPPYTPNNASNKPKGHRDPALWSTGAALLSFAAGLGLPAALLSALGVYWYITSANNKLLKKNTDTTGGTE